MCPLRVKTSLAHLDREVANFGRTSPRDTSLLCPENVSISVSLLSVLARFSDTPSSAECVVSSLLASSLCFCAPSSYPPLLPPLLYICYYVPSSYLGTLTMGTAIFLPLLPFLGPIFFQKSAQLLTQHKVLVNLKKKLLS